MGPKVTERTNTKKIEIQVLLFSFPPGVCVFRICSLCNPV